jgi:hypothetical protein
MSRRFLLTSFFFFLASSGVSAATLNAGIVQGIWLSAREAFVGDTVTLYAAVQNQSDKPIGGKVTFFTKSEGLETEVGNARFTVFPNELKRVAVPFTVSYGMQNLTAKVLLDGQETAISINAPVDSIFIDSDSDGDRIGDLKDEDDDNDGISDVEEARLGTDPAKSDTDGDGISDKEEVDAGTNPTKQDTDSDGLPDNQEKALGTNPNDADSDNDGIADGEEVRLHLDPKKSDSDGDGIPDGQEVATGGNSGGASSGNTTGTTGDTSGSGGTSSSGSGVGQTISNFISSITGGSGSSSAGNESVSSTSTSDTANTDDSDSIVSTVGNVASEMGRDTAETLSPIATWVANKTEEGASSLASVEPKNTNNTTPSKPDISVVSSKNPISGILSGFGHTFVTMLHTLIEGTAPWYAKTASAFLIILAFFIRWWLWTLLLILCIYVYRRIRRSSRFYNRDEEPDFNKELAELAEEDN